MHEKYKENSDYQEKITEFVNTKDSSGNTPLHESAEKGYIYTSKILVENHADIYALNNDFKTPVAITKEDEIKNIILNTANDLAHKFTRF